MNTFISFEPGTLTFGILNCVLFYLSLDIFQRGFALEIRLELLIADSLQYHALPAIAIYQLADFLLQTSSEHCRNPLGNPCFKLIGLKSQANNQRIITKLAVGCRHTAFRFQLAYKVTRVFNIGWQRNTPRLKLSLQGLNVHPLQTESFIWVRFGGKTKVVQYGVDI